MPWNRIYMGNFWVQIFTELSRKSQDYISRKRGFHIKLMGPKSHWIPRKSSQNVKYWQNLTDLRYQAVKFHRLSSSRNLTESSRLNPTEWCFHGKIIGKLTQNFHRIPSLLNVSKPRKFSQNVTVETSQAFVIKPWNFTEHLPHGISQGRNLTEGLGGNFHWNAFFILHFSWQSPFFSHDDFHWIQGSRNVFDFPSLSGKPRNSRNSVFYNAWPLYPLETGLLSIRK